MIKPEQVPIEAMNALLHALRLRKGGKEAIAAALNAWEGAMFSNFPEDDKVRVELILPLPPQENSDEL